MLRSLPLLAVIPDLEPSAAGCFLLVAGLLTSWAVLGWMLLPFGEEAGWMEGLPVRMAAGMATMAALLACWGLGRWSYLSLMPLAMFLHLAWSVRWRKAALVGAPPCPGWQEGAAVALMMVLVFALTWLDGAVVTADGRIAGLNADLGYFALLAKALPEAGVATTWTAVLGGAAAAAGESRDIWYHWGPVWLVTGVAKVTGLPELAVLLKVVAPALNVLLVLLAARVVRKLTSLGAAASLLAGAVSLLAVTWPSMSLAEHLGRWLPGGVLQHFHPSLAYQFSYKFEAVLVLASMACWLSRKPVLASVLLFCAGISAPHTVAGGGLAAGTLGLCGIVLRQWRLILSAAVICGVLVLSWASIHFLFGVGMPKTDSTKFIELAPDHLMQNAINGLKDTLIGALLALPLWPGLWHLLRRRQDDTASGTLGWMALAALAGSYCAFHLLLPEGDRAHFTMYAHAFVVVPVGVWGLLGLWGSAASGARATGMAALLFVAGSGVYELVKLRDWQTPLAIRAEDAARVKEILRGQTWGYFAMRDRNWWIPQHAILAGVLDSRCVRVNEIESKDRHNHAARFYGSTRPYDLVPRQTGESDVQWGLRFAAALEIGHFIEMSDDPFPAEALRELDVVLAMPGMRLLRTKNLPANTPPSPITTVAP